MKNKIIYVDFSSKNKKRKKNLYSTKSKFKLVLILKYLKRKISNILKTLAQHKKLNKHSKNNCSKKTF